jgi:hypothetical protein
MLGVQGAIGCWACRGRLAASVLSGEIKKLKLIISWKRCYLFLCFAYSFQTAVNYVK